MRDELTFSDSDNEHIPDSPILFITNQNNKQVKQNNKTENRIQTKHILKSNEVRDEFTFNADDNEDAPIFPISLPFVTHLIARLNILSAARPKIRTTTP